MCCTHRYFLGATSQVHCIGIVKSMLFYRLFNCSRVWMDGQYVVNVKPTDLPGLITVESVDGVSGKWIIIVRGKHNVRGWLYSITSSLIVTRLPKLIGSLDQWRRTV